MDMEDHQLSEVTNKPLESPVSEVPIKSEKDATEGSQQKTNQNVSNPFENGNEQWKILCEMQKQFMNMRPPGEDIPEANSGFSIPEFNPDLDCDAKAWCDIIDLFLQEKPLSGSDLVDMLKKTLQGTAATWLAQGSLMDLTWPEIKELFLARFYYVETPAAMLIRLFNSSPKDGEGITTYVNRFLTHLTSQWKCLSTEQIAIAVTLAHACRVEPRLQSVAITTNIPTCGMLQQQLKAFTDRKRAFMQDESELQTTAKKPCVNLTKCNICDKLGHEDKDCPTSKEQNQDMPINSHSGKIGKKAVEKKIQLCFICRKPGHKAYDCKMNVSNGQQKALKICRKCKNTGHTAGNCKTKVRQNTPMNSQSKLLGQDESELQNIAKIPCVNVIKCNIFNKLGHEVKDCSTSKEQIEDAPSNSQPGGTGQKAVDKKVLCFKCKQPGHKAIFCNNNVSDEQLNVWITCSKCKQPGHTAKKCNTKVSQNTLMNSQSELSGQPQLHKHGNIINECTTTVSQDIPVTSQPDGLGQPAMLKKIPWCYKCSSPGHTANHCTTGVSQVTQIPQSGVSGQQLATLTQKPPNKNERTCNNCNKVGHLARNCRKRVKLSQNIPMTSQFEGSGQQAMIKRCFTCHSTDHMQACCPFKNQNSGLKQPNYRP